MTANARPLSSLLVATLAVACSGQITGGAAGGGETPGGTPGSTGATGGGGGGAGGSGSGGPGAEVRCNQARTAFAPARIWQLTDRQYVNVVRDVFGITLSEEDGRIISPGTAERYTNYSESTTIDSQAAPNYQTVALKVADLAQVKMAALVGSANPTSAEMESFIDTRVARAWRRPLTTAERAALAKLYSDAARLDGPARGFHLLLEAALQAGSFLYRTELGTGAASARGEVTLSPHELASALSFFFLDSGPDDALWARAQAGTLTDPAVLGAEVDRLMKLPAARANLALRASYWLGVAGIGNRSRSNLYPEWNESLKASLSKSVGMFLDEVIGGGKLSDLFTSNRVYVNQQLGRVYGIQGATGTSLVAVAVPGSERAAGILSQPGFLVAANRTIDRADVVHRGLLVNDAFVCGGTIPPAPPEAGDEAKKISGTERERAQARASKPNCSPCHTRFDPLGLNFERYDALGRYSETRQAVLDSDTGVTSWQTTTTPIDASGVLPDDGRGDGLAGRIDGVNDLAMRLASAPERVGLCASRKLAEYALGYNPEAEGSCALEQVKQVLVRTGSFAEYFRALAVSPGFRTRNPLPPPGP
jgi:hypothetical protein